MYTPVYAKHKLSNNMSFVKNNLTAISVERKSNKLSKNYLKLPIFMIPLPAVLEYKLLCANFCVPWEMNHLLNDSKAVLLVELTLFDLLMWIK